LIAISPAIVTNTSPASREERFKILCELSSMNIFTRLKSTEESTTSSALKNGTPLFEKLKPTDVGVVPFEINTVMSPIFVVFIPQTTFL
jgi:hypothetical protein